MKIKIPDEVIKRAEEIDLLTYLETYEPDELVRLTGDEYCTKTHDSLKISNGKWMWWSRGIGGYNALSYLIKVKDMEFADAVMLLASENNIGVYTEKHHEHETIKPENKEEFFRLPDKADNNDKAIEYLRKRGISEDVIMYFIDKGYIYQSRDKNNVVFVGADETDKPRYASMRGTEDRRFFKDVRGSDKTYSFRYINKDAGEIHLFESAIDLLSYATLLEQQGSDWKNQDLVSLSGVYTPKTEDHLPMAIEKLLRNNEHVKEVHLHLDNDEAGINATEALMKILSKDHNVSYHFVTAGKDVNDYLCYKNKLNIKKIQERDVCR